MCEGMVKGESEIDKKRGGRGGKGENGLYICIGVL